MSRSTDSTERRETFRRLFWPILIIVCVTLVQVIQGGGHSLEIEVDDTQMAVVADGGDAQFLPFADIRQVELVTELESWTLVDGSEDETVTCGFCHSEAYGDFQMYAYTGSDAYIVVQTEETYYVYSLSTTRKTEKKFEELQEAMALQ